jgi:hypothetical protein
MLLKDINTSKFVFDPKSKDFEEKVLLEVDSADLSKDRKKWFTYLSIVYDPASEIRRNHREYIQRKFIAAQIAGFELDESGRFSNKTEEKLLKQDRNFNKVVCNFCRVILNKDYELYELLIEKFNLEIRKRQDSGEPLDETGRKNLQAMKADIEELEIKIFGGEESVGLKDQLYNHLLEFLLDKYHQGIEVHKNSDKSLSNKDRQLLQNIKSDIEILEKTILGIVEVDLKKQLYEGVDSVKDPLPRKEVEMVEFEKNGLMPYSPYGLTYKPDKLRFVGDKIPQ